MPVLIDQVDTQLSTNLPSFNTTAKAWTAKPVDNFDTETPAALYYLSGVQSEPSPYDADIIIQPSEQTITVLIVCEVDSLETLRAELLAAFVGFQPAGGTWDQFEHTTGQSLDIDGSIVWWSDSFVVSNYQGET